jgi:hypothetical protein
MSEIFRRSRPSPTLETNECPFFGGPRHDAVSVDANKRTLFKHSIAAARVPIRLRADFPPVRYEKYQKPVLGSSRIRLKLRSDSCELVRDFIRR